MCAERSTLDLLTYKEAERLSKFRKKVFDSGKKPVGPDEAPSEMYSDKTGFTVYLGASQHASDLSGLESLGVTYILNMAGGDPACGMTQEDYGDRYRCMRVSAVDSPGYDLSQHFDGTWTFIEEAREKKAKVLVHCSGGVSRSASTIIAYLMQLKHWKLETASKHVHKRRPRAFPNLGFLKQLELHQTKLSGTVGKLH